MGYFLSGNVIQARMVARQLRWQLIQLGQCRIYSENLFVCFRFLFSFRQISSVRDAIKSAGFLGQEIQFSLCQVVLSTSFGFEILNFAGCSYDEDYVYTHT